MSVRGFICVERESLQLLEGATIGAVVPRKYWVVHFELSRFTLHSWPARLLAVEIAEPGPDKPRPGLKLTRAASVRILEELDPAQLFGAHGAAVVELIEAARSMTLEQVKQLAAVDAPGAEEAYQAAFQAWRDGTPPDAGGPIGSGFTVLHLELKERAAAQALIEKDGELVLAPPWDQADRALKWAAMALGAPEWVPAGKHEVLLRPWRTVRDSLHGG